MDIDEITEEQIRATYTPKGLRRAAYEYLYDTGDQHKAWWLLTLANRMDRELTEQA